MTYTRESIERRLRELYAKECWTKDDRLEIARLEQISFELALASHN